MAGSTNTSIKAPGGGAQVRADESHGMNIGGLTDAEARAGITLQGVMLRARLLASKSLGLKVPGQ